MGNFSSKLDMVWFSRHTQHTCQLYKKKQFIILKLENESVTSCQLSIYIYIYMCLSIYIDKQVRSPNHPWLNDPNGQILSPTNDWSNKFSQHVKEFPWVPSNVANIIEGSSKKRIVRRVEKDLINVHFGWMLFL